MSSASARACHFEDPIIDTTYTAVVAGERIMDAMATYTGPAVLVLADVEVHVQAALTSYIENGRGAWRGTLTAASPDSLWDGVGRHSCQIRTPDGRLGEVVVIRLKPGPGDEFAEVLGSGPAPF
jgi:hypothetical protein